ncbi:MAG TPA: hypothetical protein VMY06_00770 [Sedimentisphaerales bacterium]|nr:hypothetical protein [Sedimentisphaerales bacterium]
MTEELEQKLNELLGLKKQLEEITEGKQKTVASSVVKKYKKKNILNWIFFWLTFVLGMAFISFGLIVIQLTDGVLYIDSPTCIIVGLLILMFARMLFRIRQNKLEILQEMKQFELRITEMLKK